MKGVSLTALLGTLCFLSIGCQISIEYKDPLAMLPDQGSLDPGPTPGPSPTPTPTPSIPPGPLKIQIGDSIKKIATGGAHTCAILLSGDVKCWGENSSGQLGYDDQVDRGGSAASMEALSPVNLGAGRTAADITLGYNFTCAILDTGDVKCWGQGGWGQLGTNDSNNLGATPGSMATIAPVHLGGFTAKAISAGADFVCVILNTDEMKCWGNSGDGQAGYDRGDDLGDAPNEMQTLGIVNVGGANNKVKKIATGALHTCAILESGAVKCWGYNGEGQLGAEHWDNIGDGRPGSTTMAALGVVNLGAHTAIDIATGDYHTCVILNTGDVKCWGSSYYGETGYDDYNSLGGTPGDMAALGAVNLGGRTAKSISAGAGHTCAILDNDKIKCWGSNYDGELGLNTSVEEFGSTAGSMAALSTVDVGTGITVKQMDLGDYFTCALLSTDDMKCWGSNSSGQLGQNTSANYGGTDMNLEDLATVNLATPGVLQVQVGESHSCALLSSGDVKCWGLNTYGQLGYGDTNPRGGTVGDMASLGTVNLGAGKTAKKLAVGSNHTCVILNDDSVKCWGRSDYGQLGYDDTASRGGTVGSMAALTTVNLGGPLAKDLVAGKDRTCAILDTNELKCWGRNDFGQLGYNSIVNKGDTVGSMAALGVVNVGAGRTVKSVAVAVLHTCAILDTNEIKCWGYGSFGQLGYDSFNNKGDTAGSMATLGVVNLGPGRTAKAVAVGQNSTCAILDTNEVKCWGIGDNGVRGYDNTLSVGSTPGSMAALGVVNLGLGRTAKAIEMGFFSTCVIMDNDQMKCWGKNRDGQLGFGNTKDQGSFPGSMSNLGAINFGVGRSVKSMAIYNHACAILDTNELKCWGTNDSGQLGYDNDKMYGGSITTSKLLLIGK